MELKSWLTIFLSILSRTRIVQLAWLAREFEKASIEIRSKGTNSACRATEYCPCVDRL